MKPDEALKILGLPEGVTEREREEAFKSQRAKLEQKLAQAPTPGLQNKYRESIRRLEEAYETLELLNEDSDLPALNPDFGGGTSKTTPVHSKIEPIQKSHPVDKSDLDSRHDSSTVESKDEKTQEQPLGSAAAKSGGGNAKWALVTAVLLVIGLGWYFVVEKPAEEQKLRVAGQAAAQAAEEAAQHAAQQAQQVAKATEEKHILRGTDVVALNKLADAGNSVAMTKLGYMYLYGVGVDKDYTIALSWFGHGVHAGNNAAMFWIGYMYENGFGVDINYTTAMNLFLGAASAGQSEAMVHIGSMYETGLGVNQDSSKAAWWYLKAAKLGNNDAKQALQRLGIPE